MKVLMTCDAVGGVWQYATDLTRALAGQGIEVVLAVLGPASPGEEAAEGLIVIEPGLPLDWLSAGPEDVLRTGRAIAALATEHGVDLIHLNSPALAAAGPFPVPVIAVAHGCIGSWFAALGEVPGPDLAWHEALVGEGLRTAAEVVAPSAAHATLVQRHYALPAMPRAIHNGRAPAYLPRHAPADHVLTAGRLWDRAKNVALLDAVAARLAVPLRAAGPLVGPHGESVAPAHLRLLGTLDPDGLAAEYAQAPIFVSPARFEPFGLAVLEAAQAGCPLILSGIDTFRELWTGAALFVNDDDPASWAAAIERVRGDDALRAHLSDAARQRTARYTVDAMAAGMLATYRRVLPVSERRAA